MDPRNEYAREHSEEEELAAYLEDVISGVLARRAMEMFSKPHDPVTPHRFARQAAEQPASVMAGTGEPVVEGDGAVTADQTTAEDVPVLHPPAKRGRSSMRSELMELFRRTEPTGVRPPNGTLREVPRAAAAPEAELEQQTAFLPLFLQQLREASDLCSTGIPELDSLLAGGLGHGLHLVAGPDGAGKTAFLECMLWEATSSKRSVIYYPLKEGRLVVWMRLISTLGAILGGPRVSLDELRTRTLQPGSLETLQRLDRQLQQMVLPLLALADVIPAHADVLGAFIRDVSARVGSLAGRNRQAPLVLLDDIDRLLRLASDPAPFASLSRLDEAMVATRVSLVAAVRGRRVGDLVLGDAPVQTVIELKPASGGTASLRPLLLSVRANSRTGRTPELSVVLDGSSGLFAC